MTIQGKKITTNMEDREPWKETKDENFSVQSFYSALKPRSAVSFPQSIIWSPCVPTKVGFFGSEASWGKVLTLDRLKRRGWHLANRCFLCGVEEESIDHILINCTKARVLWELLFALFGVLWVLPFSVKDTLLDWHGFSWARSIERLGWQLPYVSFGRYGRKGTELLFKMRSFRFKG